MLIPFVGLLRVSHDEYPNHIKLKQSLTRYAYWFTETTWTLKNNYTSKL